MNERVGKEKGGEFWFRFFRGLSIRAFQRHGRGRGGGGEIDG